MNILVSACLLGVECRYDGGHNYCGAADRLKEKHHLIPVCPEVYGGLPVPRVPSEILKERVISAEGNDVTEEFYRGARAMMHLARYFGCRLAVLKERSPSCGSGEIYDGTFSGRLTAGDGIFVRMLKEEGIAVIGESQIEDFTAGDCEAG